MLTIVLVTGRNFKKSFFIKESYCIENTTYKHPSWLDNITKFEKYLKSKILKRLFKINYLIINGCLYVI